jgi:hypothetical protein
MVLIVGAGNKEGAEEVVAQGGEAGFEFGGAKGQQNRC